MKIGRIILILFIFFFVSYNFNTISFSNDVAVKQGDSYRVFYDAMSWFDRLTFKLYLRLHYQKAPVIYPGLFRIEKGLSYRSFLEFISKPPVAISKNITLLEGRSSYDYDEYLVEKGLILSGEYLSYINNKEFLDTMKSSYEFLPKDLKSLEGFLYPDTYRVDANKSNIVKEIIIMQLNNFYNKVRGPDPGLFTNFSQKIRKDGFSFSLSTYSIIKLSSIIENEEKNNKNKQTIAGLFLNRIDQGMQLGADVTLCYGKGVTYSVCTPKFIVDNLYDKSNLYNTRIHSGLTPTPISNPSVQTIAAVLSYTKSDYLYYLHDSKGGIHYGRNLEEHNTNKSQYIP